MPERRKMLLPPLLSSWPGSESSADSVSTDTFYRCSESLGWIVIADVIVAVFLHLDGFFVGAGWGKPAYPFPLIAPGPDFVLSDMSVLSSSK
jgi:hypothetical protein